MKLGTMVAAAGVALLMSLGGASAQATNSGTGDATMKDRPSQAGLSNPGGQPRMGMRMRMHRHHRMHMRHHRMHMRHHRMHRM